MGTGSDRDEQVKILFFVWMFTGFFIQLLIARVIVIMSKSANNISTKEVWSCFKLQTNLIGRIMSSEEAKAAMNELMQDERL